MKGFFLISVYMAAVAMLVSCVVTASKSEELLDPTPEEYASIQKWIPSTCCWTNNCCKKVHPSALVALPKNMIKVVETGQILTRSGWSQDKNTWRCTCDNVGPGEWKVHPKAKTFCVFDHPYGS